MSNPAVPPISGRRPPAALTILLAFVFAFFVGVLVFVYVATKRAHPVMLDQNGKPVAEQTSAPSDSH